MNLLLEEKDTQENAITVAFLFNDANPGVYEIKQKILQYSVIQKYKSKPIYFLNSNALIRSVYFFSLYLSSRFSVSLSKVLDIVFFAITSVDEELSKRLLSYGSYLDMVSLNSQYQQIRYVFSIFDYSDIKDSHLYLLQRWFVHTYYI